MLSFLGRLTVAVLLVLGICYGTKYMMVYRLAMHVDECLDHADRVVITDPKATETEKLRVTAKGMSCVAHKQSFIDRFFFDVRDFFNDPSQWPFPIDEYRP